MNLMKRVTLTLLLSGFGLPAIAANGEMDTATMTNGNYVVGPTFNYPFNTNSYSDNNRIANSNASVWPTTAANTVDNDGLIESQQSQLLGEWALRQINEEAPRITDAWLQQTLEQIVWQINAVARADAPMALVLIDDRQINAFAVPAGVIGINVGLLDKSKNLDEVASVISHEIAHVSQRHYQHRNDEKTKHLLLQLGGMLAGVAAASAGAGDAEPQ